MYVERTRKRQAGKTHEQILLRESHRVGRQVKKRTLLNLTHYPLEQVEAIEWALKNPETVDRAMAGETMNLKEGKSVGAAWAVAKTAERLGIAKALGKGRQGQLALWQVIARVLEQGSRLSAVRLHETHALAEAVGLEQGFDEDDLYENLAWLSSHQPAIERRLFEARREGARPRLFCAPGMALLLEGVSPLQA